MDILQFSMRPLILSFDLLFFHHLAHICLSGILYLDLFKLHRGFWHNLVITQTLTHGNNFPFLSLLTFLLLFLLFLPPLQKLISSHIIRNQVQMQENKIEKQKSKNSHKQGRKPSSNNLRQLTPLFKINTSTANNRMHNNNNSKSKSRHDTHHKRSIITPSHTVIKPHTMMVESTHTSVATSTVLARCKTVAIAEFTI